MNATHDQEVVVGGWPWELRGGQHAIPMIFVQGYWMAASQKGRSASLPFFLNVQSSSLSKVHAQLDRDLDRYSLDGREDEAEERTGKSSATRNACADDMVFSPPDVIGITHKLLAWLSRLTVQRIDASLIGQVELNWPSNGRGYRQFCLEVRQL